MDNTDRVFFHIDVNNAFLSWEALYRMRELGEETDIRELPAIIGGDVKSRRGVVLAKSMLAKKYGIKSGEPVTNAMKKCPGLLLFPPHMGYYKDRSRELMAIFMKYAPEVEQYSIDEAFLDMTGTRLIYGDPIEFAYKLKDEIRDSLGFTVNVGISSNRLLAKMASDFQKPDKVHTLFPDEIEEKMWPLPVEDLFYVGESSAKGLHLLGLHTIGDIAKCDKKLMIDNFKSHGEMMWNFARGIDETFQDSGEWEQQGYSHSTTIAYDVIDADDAKKTLLKLSEMICKRMRRDDVAATVLAVELKDNNLVTKRHQRKLLSPTNVTDECYKVACELFDSLWTGFPIRLIGISASKVVDESVGQMNLFDMETHEKKQKLEGAIDDIRDRFGSDAITRGSFM